MKTIILNSINNLWSISTSSLLMGRTSISNNSRNMGLFAFGSIPPLNSDILRKFILSRKT